ncbi:MAG: hypothetical protein Q7R76_05810 [Candidatus Woesearchaeota archaeon]|nr:hypothetical protein [Candidatus Woesearchaeota archaeon]
MATCHKCPLPIYYSDFCEQCFCDLLERRIKKYIGQHELLKKNDVLYVDNDLVDYFLKKLFTLPLTLVRTPTDGASAKRVLAWTMDHELEFFLDELMTHGLIAPEKPGLKFFLAVTKSELQAYTAAKNIPLPDDLKPAPKHDLMKPSGLVSIPGSGGDFLPLNTIQTPADILNELEKRHHETRASLMKSIEQLKLILKEDKTI